jgi:hypothetical protein
MMVCFYPVAAGVLAALTAFYAVRLHAIVIAGVFVVPLLLHIARKKWRKAVSAASGGILRLTGALLPTAIILILAPFYEACYDLPARIFFKDPIVHMMKMDYFSGSPRGAGGVDEVVIDKSRWCTIDRNNNLTDVAAKVALMLLGFYATIFALCGLILESLLIRAASKYPETAYRDAGHLHHPLK